MPGMRSAALGIWVDVGSRDERPAVAGASHFLEHLLFKGTRTRSARHIAEAFDAVAPDGYVAPLPAPGAVCEHLYLPVLVQHQRPVKAADGGRLSLLDRRTGERPVLHAGLPQR